MIKIQVDTTITPDLIDKLIIKYHSNNICIVIENTKKQTPSQLEAVAKKYPNITISVLGGLNPKKNKFNYEYYQKRTYYTPMELSKIVKIFCTIERKINLSWTDTQKVMFYYQELCNYMEYSECDAYGKDVARNLGGLLYRKAVCSGFAMIFKEVLDRLGIENIYQNIISYHSWNIAYIEGNYRAFELTWDCGHKKNEGCQFYYFNRDADFYKNEHHNLQEEKEEREYPIVPYTLEELRKNYKVINSRKIKTIKLNNQNETSLEILGKNYIFKNISGTVNIYGSGIKSFIRNDNTKFALTYVNNVKNLNKFIYFDLSNPTEVKATAIFSEIRLDRIDPQYDYTIANGLLSPKRIARKINEFNGYVGYIGKNHTIYYDSSFEEKTLNIIR